MALPRGGSCNKGEKEKKHPESLERDSEWPHKTLLFPEGVWGNNNKHFLSTQYLPGVWMILQQFYE